MLFFNCIRSAPLPSSSRRRRSAAKHAALHCAVGNALEPLESRRLYSVTAVAGGGVLTVTGDNSANVITVSRDVAGNLLVNNGEVHITGATPATITNIQDLRVFGLDGNDSITLDTTNGALPAAKVSADGGNDTVIGGAGDDIIDGGDGNNLLLGNGGNDTLVGGDGNDTLIGGAGSDNAFGGLGDDRMIWNPGDGSDVNDGGDGNDTVVINGGNVGETFAANPGATAGHVLFQRLDPLPFSVDISNSEKLILSANGGNDTFQGGVGLANLISFDVDGGDGNDTLLGTDGADTLRGGNGNDFIDGNGGADLVLMGAGNDTFVWDPGDGSDIVEGGTGVDQMIFNGASGNENVDLSNNGGRLKFFRDAGRITMDVNDVERVTFNALGGADNVTIHNLRGTDVTNVNVNLTGATRTGGDGQLDSVVVEGTVASDLVTVAGGPGAVFVNGLATAVRITGADPTDKLEVDGLDGNDLIVASALNANAIAFTANGGAGNDILIGSDGNDTLLGGDGNDILIGAAGNDQLNGGAGVNVLVQ